MTKQPTRLANFEIPREQPPAPTGDPNGKPEGIEAPKPAFLKRADEVRRTGQQPAASAAAPPVAEPPPPPVVARVEPPAPVQAPVPAPAPAPAAPPAAPALAAPVPLPPAVQVPQPMPRPAEEPRRQIGARVRVSLAERLRTYMFVSRESQQDAVEGALDAYLSSRGF